MSDNLELRETAESCGPEATEVCESCAPKQAVTPDEEAALERMREVKKQVREVNERLREIKPFKGETTRSDALEENAEWRELFSKLEDLRGRWAEWRAKLDEAIDRKMVALGHKEP